MSRNTLTNEEFWTEFRDILFSDERLGSAEEEIEKMLSLAGKEKGSVLDIPCGIGRHSVELSARGFDVTGVDKTGEYIEEARDKYSGDIEFICHDMKKFNREQGFDLIINGWNSFGYFERKEDDRKMLENIHTSLKEDGVLVMDLWSKELVAMNDRGRHWTETDGIYNMEKKEIQDNWKKVRTTWTKVEEGETVEYTWEQRLYSASELEDLLEEAGFSAVNFYGSLEGAD